MDKTAKATIIKHGLRPVFWIISQDREDHLIIRNRFTGECKFLWK